MSLPRLILASGSPFRRQLLAEGGFEVEAIPPDIAEPDPASFADLHAGLMHVALLKAQSAAGRGATGLIFAADTIGHLPPVSPATSGAGELSPQAPSLKSQGSSSRTFGKPVDRADARRMLLAISGTTHSVLTGWCLLRTEDRLHLAGVEETVIDMRPWSDGELNNYLDSREWEGKSGAYGLQFPHDPFVTRITGSASNVVGVPLERLRQLFVEFPSLVTAEFPRRTPP